MLISVSKLKAGTDMNLNASGDIVVSGQYDQTNTDKSTANRMSSMNSKNNTGDQTQNYTFVGSSLDAGNTLNIKAGNNLDFAAAKLSSGANTNLTAEEGQVRFRTQKNINVVSHTFDNEDLVYEVHKGDGNQNESLVYTQMKTGGKLNVDAAKGVVVEVEEVPVTPAAEETIYKESTAHKDSKEGDDDKNKASATFSASTAALVKQPGMEWMGQMLKRDDVDWQKALAAHDHWDYKSQGLTKAGAVILTIVVTYFTAGTASGVAESTSAAAGGGAVGTAAGAAAAAAVTSLATTAAVSFANNGGDLGKTLEDMGRSENIRGLLTAMVTAGVLSSLNTTLGMQDINANSKFTDQLQKSVINNVASTTLNHAINGGDFQQQLEQSLKSALIDTGAAQSADWIGDVKRDRTLDTFTHKLAHAIAGCAAGAAKSDDCGSGALGAVVGEISAERYAPDSTAGMSPQQIADMKTDTVNFARMMAGVAAAVTGGDANLAASAGGNAAENNYLYHYKGKIIAYDKNDNDKIIELSERDLRKLAAENPELLMQVIAGIGKQDGPILVFDSSATQMTGSRIVDLNNPADRNQIAKEADMGYINLTEPGTRIYVQTGMDNARADAGKSARDLSELLKQPVGYINNGTEGLSGDVGEYLPNSLSKKDVLNEYTYRTLDAKGPTLIVMHSAGNEDARKALLAGALYGHQYDNLSFVSVGSPVGVSPLQTATGQGGTQFLGQVNDWRDPVTYSKTAGVVSVGSLLGGIGYGAVQGCGAGVDGGLLGCVLGGGVGAVTGGIPSVVGYLGLNTYHPFERYIAKPEVQSILFGWLKANPPVPASK